MSEKDTPMHAADFFEFVEECTSAVALSAYENSQVADLERLCKLPLGELSAAAQYIVSFYEPMANNDSTEEEYEAFDWEELENLLVALRTRSGLVLAELTLLQNDMVPEDGDILDDLASRDLGLLARECSRLYFKGIERDVERMRAAEGGLS